MIAGVGGEHTAAGSGTTSHAVRVAVASDGRTPSVVPLSILLLGLILRVEGYDFSLRD